MGKTNTNTCCLKCGVVKTPENSSKNKTRPDGRMAYCKACMKYKQAETYLRNRESVRAKAKLNYAEKKDEYKARARKWALANPVKRKEVAQKYSDANKDKRYVIGRRARLAKPGVYAAHYKMRQTRKRRALSSWANLDAIEALYIECARITKETGIKHHVDHYYPLTSDVVCGLHNEFNLRIIPAVENLSKGNSFPEDHP